MQMELPESFNENELLILNNALNEVLNGPEAIGSEEFHARIGANIMDTEALLSKIKSRLTENES